MEKRTRRKSPKSAKPTKKVTVYIAVDLDADIYRAAEQEGLGISEMYDRLLRAALAARTPQE